MVVDRVQVREDAEKRLRDSIRTASELAGGLVLIVAEDGTETLYSEKLACVECGASLPEFEPRSFSFNSRFGACDGCGGLGVVWDPDPEKLIRFPDRPLKDSGWPTSVGLSTPVDSARRYAFVAGVDLGKPWNQLSAEEREWLLHGWQGNLPQGHVLRRIGFAGVIAELRSYLEMSPGYQPTKGVIQYMSHRSCPDCSGARLNAASRFVRVAGLSISDMARMPLADLNVRLHELRLEGRKQEVAERILEEIRQRVDFLSDVGLGYLCLDRPAATLSGGEAQRVRLATQIGTRLRGVLYVLDEPSIGLHSRDHGRLLDALVGLRDIGNTVVVVEHDQATIERADHVIDLGPGAGRLGGRTGCLVHPRRDCE